MPVYLIATLDTKGREAAFLRDVLLSLGVDVRLVDAGSQGEPTVPADVPREHVFQAAGVSIEDVRKAGDRGQAVTAAARGVAALIQQLHAEGRVSGVLGLGGSAGTTIATTAMRALPLGVPKLMVSTLASGQVRHYVGDKDVLMCNSIVDISGINRISRIVLTNAAYAMAGMCGSSSTASLRLHHKGPEDSDKPLIAATMFGVTTPCIEHARPVLEAAGYEVLVFHATGSGGQAMESLIAEGLIAGVLDITTTELADELAGGVLTAGPLRLTAAAKAGIPQVVSVGALDMVNFGPFQTTGLPAGAAEALRGRKFHRHNANVTLMRTTPEENARLGQELGSKVAASRGPASILLPLQGVSAIDRSGQPFDDPAARQSLFDAIRRHHGAVELIEFDHHINDREFAEAAAGKLLAMLDTR